MINFKLQLIKEVAKQKNKQKQNQNPDWDKFQSEPTLKDSETLVKQ